MSGIRVLAVVEYFPPVLGHDLRIFELARRLPREWGIRFLVLPPLRPMMEGKRLAPNPPVEATRIEAVPLPLMPWLGSLWRKTTAVPYLLTIAVLLLHGARVARHTKPSVIVANYPSPYTGLLGYALGRLRSVPFVVDFCDDIVAYYEGLFPSRSPFYLLNAAVKVQNFLIRKSAVLPVVTRALWDYAVKQGVWSARMELLPNGVDIELFGGDETLSQGPDANAHSTIRCFYGGSLDTWSGVNLLTELARLGRSSREAIELHVAGRPFPRGHGELPPNLHHVGFLDKVELARAIQACDCVLVPMAPGSIADAASPVKLFEGLAAGKPCICSRTGGISEVITDGENGLLVETLDADAWLSKIRSLTTDPELRRRLSENARTTAARFEWTAIASAFASLIERTQADA